MLRISIKIISIMNITVMAADSDGDLIETVVTCEGDLGDPEFPRKFEIIVDHLNTLLCKGKENLIIYTILIIDINNFFYVNAIIIIISK